MRASSAATRSAHPRCRPAGPISSSRPSVNESPSATNVRITPPVCRAPCGAAMHRPGTGCRANVPSWTREFGRAGSESAGAARSGWAARSVSVRWWRRARRRPRHRFRLRRPRPRCRLLDRAVGRAGPARPGEHVHDDEGGDAGAVLVRRRLDPLRPARGPARYAAAAGGAGARPVRVHERGRADRDPEQRGGDLALRRRRRLLRIRVGVDGGPGGGPGGGGTGGGGAGGGTVRRGSGGTSDGSYSWATRRRTRPTTGRTCAVPRSPTATASCSSRRSIPAGIAAGPCTSTSSCTWTVRPS